jgi:tetratricopeptide (TPR) repeat protein
MNQSTSDNTPDEKHLFKAFELLEREKAEAMLRKHGIQREAKVIRHDFRSGSFKWWMAAAVLVLALSSVFIYQNLNRHGAVQLAENALSTVGKDYDFTVRSSQLPPEMLEIQIAFSEGNWTRAEDMLEKALIKTATPDTPATTTIHFYLGVVNLQQKQFDEAVHHFDPVVEYENSTLNRDAIWLRALAHLKNNNTALALTDLKSTAQQTGWVKAKEAREILNALEKER